MRRLGESFEIVRGVKRREIHVARARGSPGERPRAQKTHHFAREPRSKRLRIGGGVHRERRRSDVERARVGARESADGDEPRGDESSRAPHRARRVRVVHRHTRERGVRGSLERVRVRVLAQSPPALAGRERVQVMSRAAAKFDVRPSREPRLENPRVGFDRATVRRPRRGPRVSIRDVRVAVRPGRRHGDGAKERHRVHERLADRRVIDRREIVPEIIPEIVLPEILPEIVPKPRDARARGGEAHQRVGEDGELDGWDERSRVRLRVGVVRPRERPRRANRARRASKRLPPRAGMYPVASPFGSPPLRHSTGVVVGVRILEHGETSVGGARRAVLERERVQTPRDELVRNLDG